MILVAIVFIMFLLSVTGDFIKSYEGLNGDMDKAKKIELVSFDINSIGKFIVMASLLLLFHSQNAE